jgi:hypothetical protein
MFNLNRVSIFHLSMRLMCAAVVLLALLWSASSARAAAPATIVVSSMFNNEVDDGACTLREAIIASNTSSASGSTAGECIAGTSEKDTIIFANSVPILLQLIGEELPAITKPVIIDGTVNEQVRVRGNGGDYVFRFAAGSAGSELRGLIIGQASIGVMLEGGKVTLADNWIGTNGTGTASDLMHSGVGVFSSDNVIGFVDADGTPHGNIISGNDGAGIFVNAGTKNSIQANVIGLGADGLAVLPNYWGIKLNNGTDTTIGGMKPLQGNTIGGNTEGIHIASSVQSTKIMRNRIGLDANAGTTSRPNVNGIRDYGSKGTVIGGNNLLATNYISGNSVGIDLATGSANIQITNNKFGLGVGNTPNPNGTSILVETAPQNLSITGNQFDFETTAIDLNTFGGSKVSGHNNCFGPAGNGMGVSYSGTAQVDFNKNWWGAADGPSGAGPGSGDPIDSAQVKFSPALTSAPTACQGWQTTLVSPADHALFSTTSTGGATVRLEWKAVPTASGYTALFPPGVGLTDGTSVQVGQIVDFGKHSWSVNTRTLDMGEWPSTNSRIFYVSIAKSPKPNAKIARNATFSWLAFPGAANYALEFYPNTNCSSLPVFTMTTSQTSTQPGVISPPSFGGNMSWKLKPDNGPQMPCLPFSVKP